MARLIMLWHATKDSLGFIPTILTFVAAGLALVLTQLERSRGFDAPLPDNWFFGGGAEGARGVLSAIASGLITVTGVVFSVTIVALQLASSQYTPRVLRSFMADRGNQLVLGVFIATFTYSLLVMRTIRSEGADSELFVPRISVTIAVFMALTSIGFLIYFIDHAAKSIQVTSILDRSSRQTLSTVERLFPDEFGQPIADHGKRLDFKTEQTEFSNESKVASDTGGYLQAVDASAIFQAGQKYEALIFMEPLIGQYVFKGACLATVRTEKEPSAELCDAVRSAFVLGRERTPEQDVELGIIGIADIAVRALSPGINDPTTAMRCIDRICEVLLALGSRRQPADRRTSDSAVVFVAKHTTFDRALDLAFDQIRHYGASNPGIVHHATTSLMKVAAQLPTANRIPVFELVCSFVRSAQMTNKQPEELARLQPVILELASVGYRI